MLLYKEYKKIGGLQMKNFSSWMIVMLGAIFWILRVIVAFCASLGKEFMVQPLDLNIEVILLFVTFLSLCFIVKRKLIAALVYLIAHGAYYGVNLYYNIMSIMDGQAIINDYTTLFFSFVGIIIPIVALFDILWEKNRTANPVDKKTDWFYKGEQYDRKLDERADKNNYRTL